MSSHVILAAGKNERLAGLVAPYMKPLLLVNGTPLIVSLVSHAMQIGNGPIVIVVSPQNAEAITQVLGAAGYTSSRLHYVVQPTPAGTVDAVWRGLLTARQDGSDTVTVTCGDNIVPFLTYKEVSNFREEACKLRISVSFVSSLEKARRFTTIERKTSQFFSEKMDPAKDQTSSGYCLWLGPFAADTKTLLDRVNDERPFINRRLARVLESIAREHGAGYIEGHCVDIGVPEALP